ncbi:MAG: helix-turn-helix domain-containing protein, partial [Ktedonobacterales bacterium]
RPAERAELLTMQEVRRHLHCSAATVHRWRRTHLLVPIQERVVATKRQLWYRRQDVLDFAERYMTAEQAASLLGCNQLTVQSWARAGVLAAVSGPGIDGAHCYRFERSVLVRSRQKRVSAHEVEQQLGISKSTLHGWIRQGKLVPLPRAAGQHCWFSGDDVHQYANQHAAPAGVSEEPRGLHATYCNL